MTKLLNKPLKAFTLYAILILVCSIPAYYLIVDSIWMEELDEHNYILREQTQEGFNKLHPTSDELSQSISLWNKIQPASTVFNEAQNSPINDSIYTINRIVSHNGQTESDRFRGLLTAIKIDGKYYKLRIETNVEEADETVLAISLITCIFITLLIVGFILLNKRLSKRIWQPFYNTLEQIKSFDLNQSKTPAFSNSDIEEFQELNQSLSKLIKNNLTIYNQQKEFTQNASHELQTPLALLKTKLDLLVQDVSLTEHQRQTIETLDESLARITRINKNLLLLAGIENKEYSIASVDIKLMLSSLVKRFKEYTDQPDTITEDVYEAVTVSANESLTEVMISNLLSNAIRHGSDNNKIHIVLKDRTLTISNSGTTSLKSEYLFKRFASASSQSPGTGLGLAIVKEIADKYAWTVSYAYKENLHFFSIKF